MNFRERSDERESAMKRASDISTQVGWQHKKKLCTAKGNLPKPCSNNKLIVDPKIDEIPPQLSGTAVYAQLIQKG